MLRVITAGLVLLLVQTAAAGTVHRCATADGKVTYTDQPCAGAAKQEVVEIEPGPKSYHERLLDEIAERDAKRAAESEEREREQVVRDREIAAIKKRHAEICAARRMHKGLEIGMDRSVLLESEVWGTPYDISTTRTAGNYQEYFVYRCGEDTSVRMFLVNGKLRSIHD